MLSHVIVMIQYSLGSTFVPQPAHRKCWEATTSLRLVEETETVGCERSVTAVQTFCCFWISVTENLCVGWTVKMIWKRGGAQVREPLILVLSLISSDRLLLLGATLPVPGSWRRQRQNVETHGFVFCIYRQMKSECRGETLSVWFILPDLMGTCFSVFSSLTWTHSFTH